VVATGVVLVSACTSTGCIGIEQIRSRDSLERIRRRQLGDARHDAAVEANQRLVEAGRRAQAAEADANAVREAAERNAQAARHAADRFYRVGRLGWPV
jgi:hypothetical protein